MTTNETNLCKCNQCRKSFPRTQLSWVYDRYGIPKKFVCPACYEKAEEEASAYRYDYLDAGEYMDEDY